MNTNQISRIVCIRTSAFVGNKPVPTAVRVIGNKIAVMNPRTNGWTENHCISEVDRQRAIEIASQGAGYEYNEEPEEDETCTREEDDWASFFREEENFCE